MASTLQLTIRAGWSISQAVVLAAIQKLAIPGIFETYTRKYIDVPTIRDYALNVECKVAMIQKIGDHIMVVGEALSAKFAEKKFPLICTRGDYRKPSRRKIPSDRKVIRVTASKMSELKNISKGQFVLKAAAAKIRLGRKVLLEKIC